MVEKSKRQELIELLFTCLETKRENDFLDMKLKWHERIDDLIKDIICFSNTVHDRDCYIFFGINDDFEIIGLNDTEKTKQADIVDTMSILHFSGSERPSFEVNTISVNDKEIDVLVIFNNNKTPIFLEKPYGKMKAGCIYSREKDRNTPDNGNATFSQIEALWRKRFGLIKSKKDFLLNNKNDWNEIYPEFYSYAMNNPSTSYYQIELMYNSNKLDNFQGVYLDSGRLFIPTARWVFIKDKMHPIETVCSYKYYIENSEEFKLLKFFYDPTNHEQKYAFSKILEIFLVFESVNEQVNFENYVKDNAEYLDKVYSAQKQYGYLEAPKGSPNYLKLEKYREALRYARSLKLMLEKWREK
ncbi:AlbA family DNA-binding domain-containing protein [Dolosigranulum pigrum]|uniref:AlbA family DNA-binding domain-containing protein n=1 Tax=Dolosigranulum pigrum TaxID=29394 RepID=UPI001AD86F9F|nr:ATP-binding protein [Dolosigranulum pigrum]QTJ55227.1 ATP-binding protein [Dolosigranulum pigrum]